ncbi:MAG: hypothetical protein QM695_03935 [Micropruina sp.]
MKTLAKILLIVAALIALFSVWLLWVAGWEVWRQFVALDALRTREFTNPVGSIVGGAAVALLAGVVCGFALALPRKPKVPPTPTAETPEPPTEPDLR